VDDWYGTYSGTISLYGTDKWSDESYEWDIYAIVDESNGQPFFEGFSDEMDLWGGDWSTEGNAVFSFWVDLTEDKMTADTSYDCWILDEDDLSDSDYVYYWYSYERDYLLICLNYYDPDYDGGFDVYITLTKD